MNANISHFRQFSSHMNSSCNPFIFLHKSNIGVKRLHTENPLIRASCKWFKPNLVNRFVPKAWPLDLCFVGAPGQASTNTGMEITHIF